jgi:phosphoacetylglucosamine mutase
MEFVSVSEVQELLAGTPPTKRLAYGTAGFRSNAADMPAAVTRVGMFSALVSHWSGSQCLGIMITASHNAEEDNGAKVADVDGGMLAQKWEGPIEAIANCMDPTDAMGLLQQLISTHSISLGTPAHVVIGRDTRPSSFELFQCACRGVEAYGGTVHDIGTATTPQLHFVVKRMNEAMKNPASFPIASQALESYYTTLSRGYFDLRGTAASAHNDSIIIDAANGIGGRAVGVLAVGMQQRYPDALQLDVRNDVGDGPVNEGCGAELVQKGQVPPANVSIEDDLNKVMCSYDGDADRIVFHSYTDMGGTAEAKWCLADGDKIACLVALILKQEFVAAGVLSEDGLPNESGISLGIVQTAYANGSSSHFLRENKIPVAFAKTGVKYLHRKAEESFDVGIYFEANGHGTVIFNENFLSLVAGWGANSDMLAGVGPRAAMARIRISVGVCRSLCAVLCCAVLCCVMLCCVMLCCVILCML